MAEPTEEQLKQIHAKAWFDTSYREWHLSTLQVQAIMRSGSSVAARVKAWVLSDLAEKYPNGFPKRDTEAVKSELIPRVSRLAE